MRKSKGPKKKKKVTKRRLDLDRPYCNGEWTIARMRSFIMSALRGARWNPKLTIIERAFSRKGINPETGMPCMLHKCEECGNEFPKGKMKADHAEPVIPINHNWANDPNNFVGYNWNEVMRRLYIEKGDGWNVICETCHNAKSESERQERTLAKKSSDPDLFL